MNDLRLAVRSLRKAKGFTAACVLTLALGIGATTAIFSVVNGVLLRPLRYPDAERLVFVRQTLPGMGLADAGLSGGIYNHYRRYNHAFDDLGLYFEEFFNLVGGGEPERIRVALLTPSVLATLGVTPRLGRLLSAADDAAGAETGVLISHGLWVRRYGADPGVIGRTIRVVGLAGERHPLPRPIVGVMPADFDFPHRDTQVWYSINTDAAQRANLRNLYLSAVGRLKPGFSPADAGADLRRLVPSLPETCPDVSPEVLQSSRLAPVVRPLKAAVVGDITSTLWILLGGVILVLLIACANVSNLFLVRAEYREKEIVLRELLGARRREIARYLLGETLLISLLGGVLGLILAMFGVRMLVAAGPPIIPRLDDVAVDLRVVAFAAGVTALAAGLVGAIPILRHGPRALAPSLPAEARATSGRARVRARNVLVTAQMALALVLLIGSALTVRSLGRLQRVDLGFDPQGVVTFQPAMSYAAYPDYRTAAGFLVRLIERLRGVPGVVAAEAVSDLPLSTGPTFGEVDFTVDTASGDGVGVAARHAFATPGYFAAMGTPLLHGRTFEAGDRDAQVPPVIVNAAFARILFRGDEAVGRRIRFAEPGWTEFLVVGVVADVAGASPGGDPANTVFFPVLADPAHAPFRRVPNGGMNVVLRTTVSSAALGPEIRRVLSELDPDLPLGPLRTMEQLAADATARNRLAMLLLSIAAAASLFLAAVGLYGVISYVVGRRTREIGVRMALGAHRAQVHGLILVQGARVAVGGVAVGVLSAFVLTRFLRTLLFEVSPTDPVTFTVMSLVLAAVALIASYLPARRAARVDPMEALRSE